MAVAEDGRYYADAKLPKAARDKQAAVAEAEASEKADVVDKEQHPYAKDPTLAEGKKVNSDVSKK